MADVLLDTLNASVNKFVRVWNDVFSDLLLLNWEKYWSGVRGFDLGKFDISLFLLTTVIAVCISLAFIANLMPETVSPGSSAINSALGGDSAAKKRLDNPGKVTGMMVYPILSCRGVEVDDTRMGTAGFMLDRNWVLIDKATHRPMTHHSNPAMARIRTDIVQDNEQMLKISIDGTDACVTIPAFPTEEWLNAHTALTKFQKNDGHEYSGGISRLFSDVCERNVALLHIGPSAGMVQLELYGEMQDTEGIGLLVASESSLKVLNCKLKGRNPRSKPLSMEDVRANVIVDGRDDDPNEENTWKRIRFTTTLPEEEALYKIDLDVKARDLDANQRRPCLGVVCVPKNGGKIRVGARVDVLETWSTQDEAKIKEL